MQTQQISNSAAAARPADAGLPDTKRLPGGATVKQAAAAGENARPDVEIFPEFPLHLCLKPLNDREDRDEAEMSRLTASIEAHGVQQTATSLAEIIDGLEHARVIDGWSRVLGSRRAGKTTIPMRLYRRPLTESEMLVLTIAGNMNRTTTSHKDQLTWLCRLAELNPTWTQAEIARAINFSGSEVSRMFTISKRFPADLQERIGTGSGMISPRGAYSLTKVNDEAKLREWAARLMDGTLKIEALEILVFRARGKKPKNASPITCRMEGASVEFPAECSWEKVIDVGNRLVEAGKRGARMPGLPPAAVLPSLLKSCPE